MAKKKKQGWQFSKAKARLRQDIIKNVVKDSETAEELHVKRNDCKKFPLENFKTNLENLRNAIIADRNRMLEDCEAYGHDRAILMEFWETNPRGPAWHRSKAKELLAQDIEAYNNNPNMKPKDLHGTRPEYDGKGKEVSIHLPP